MNPSIYPLSGAVAHQSDYNSSDTDVTLVSNNSTSSSSIKDQSSGCAQSDGLTSQEYHDHQVSNKNQNHHRDSLTEYFIGSQTNYNSDSKPKLIVDQARSTPLHSALNVSIKSETQSAASIQGMNVDTHHNNMIPSAHGSDQQINYSLQNSKNISSSSSSSMALNFSHDLSQQTSHHNQTSLHQHSESIELKHQPSSSFEVDSGSLMQSAVGMSHVWKNTMNLPHFKHPVIVDHNFLPGSDLNSFSGWPHTNNLTNQTSNITHHILEGQHMLGYPQHQRSLQLPAQDLVGASLKSQTTSHSDQTSFVLNSINHHASTSQNSSSSHQTTQPHDNLNLRSHQMDHNTSYNLSINDNQLYNSSRSDSRSHQNSIKSSFMASDRSSVHMTLGNHHQNNLAYHNPDHSNLQPSTSHNVAGSSSGTSSSSKNSIFKCPTCNEVFPLRTVYQSHLKTHSQGKGSKAKFQCELCGHIFSQKTSLNRHMKSHTGERPFPCEICAKAFSEKERLKIHMRTHTGEKPFSCNICGKSFSQKSTVKRHQTVHTGEKKFRCDCGKGFANRGNLIAHIKTRGSNHFE